jgi:hypothetical protein
MTMSTYWVGESEQVVILADEAYMSWHAAQIECHQALEAWLTAEAEDRAAANCVYRAALDREEAAARDLEWLSGLSLPPELR